MKGKRTYTTYSVCVWSEEWDDHKQRRELCRWVLLSSSGVPRYHHFMMMGRRQNKRRIASSLTYILHSHLVYHTQLSATKASCNDWLKSRKHSCETYVPLVRTPAVPALAASSLPKLAVRGKLRQSFQTRPHHQPQSPSKCLQHVSKSDLLHGRHDMSMVRLFHGLIRFDWFTYQDVYRQKAVSIESNCDLAYWMIRRLDGGKYCSMMLERGTFSRG